ncbi:hypothetical protein [Acinetobacter radioresistens]|uniref:hypothetical protein n=1 Tax=Acinetobacter radioresistens TaxID=40216 RepID=UPI0021CDB363|nr:hypothetical protein [Acinetobacter radioresistens]
MVDKTSLSGPVEIKDNSEARVAYDLMLLIANKEVGFTMSKIKMFQRNRSHEIIG